MVRIQPLPTPRGGSTFPRMADPAPSEPAPGARYTVQQYFALAERGLLKDDERVELLEGVVVAMPPRNPRHDAGINRANYALHAALGSRAALRVQSALLIQPYSAPEPDIAVVPGSTPDYDREHPHTALLVIEVADTSLAQDRLSKSRIYAAGGIPEYWIVNLRDDRVEVFRTPDRPTCRYRDLTLARRGDRVDVMTLPGVSLAVDDLLPVP
jgi:Uma2 family endonuclease